MTYTTSVQEFRAKPQAN